MKSLQELVNKSKKQPKESSKRLNNFPYFQSVKMCVGPLLPLKHLSSLRFTELK